MSLPDEVQERGRYPAWARSCCRRRNEAGATGHVTSLEVRTAVPVAPVTASLFGRWTTSLPAKGAPKARGKKVRVWLSVCSHRPRRVGVSVGSSLPRTSEVGFENVSWSGVTGPRRAPGAGRASTAGSRVRGNHVTFTGGPSRSQDRAAAAISIDPAGVVVGSSRDLAPTVTRLAAKEAALTVLSNSTLAFAPI